MQSTSATASLTRSIEATECVEHQHFHAALFSGRRSIGSRRFGDGPNPWVLSPFERLASCALRMSRCLELFDDGTLRLILMANVRPEGVMGTYYDSQIERRDAPAGSIEAERILEEGIRDLTEALKPAIEVFIEHQPEVT